MHILAISRFDLPGDPGFPLNGLYAKPTGTDIGKFFIKQLNNVVDALVIFK